MLNSASYSSRLPNDRWGVEDTEQFYKVRLTRTLPCRRAARRAPLPAAPALCSSSGPGGAGWGSGLAWSFMQCRHAAAAGIDARGRARAGARLRCRRAAPRAPARAPGSPPPARPPARARRACVRAQGVQLFGINWVLSLTYPDARHPRRLGGARAGGAAVRHQLAAAGAHPGRART